MTLCVQMCILNLEAVYKYELFVSKELSSRKVMGDAGECYASWEAERTTCEIASHVVHEGSRQQVFWKDFLFSSKAIHPRKKTAETFDPTVLRRMRVGSPLKHSSIQGCSIYIKTQILKMTTEYENCFSSNGESKTICCNCLRMQSARDSVLRLTINPLSLRGQT